MCIDQDIDIVRWVNRFSVEMLAGGNMPVKGGLILDIASVL